MGPRCLKMTKGMSMSATWTAILNSTTSSPPTLRSRASCTRLTHSLLSQPHESHQRVQNPKSQHPLLLKHQLFENCSRSYSNLHQMPSLTNIKPKHSGLPNATKSPKNKPKKDSKMARNHIPRNLKKRMEFQRLQYRPRLRRPQLQLLQRLVKMKRMPTCLGECSLQFLTPHQLWSLHPMARVLVMWL